MQDRWFSGKHPGGIPAVSADDALVPGAGQTLIFGNTPGAIQAPGKDFRGEDGKGGILSRRIFDSFESGVG